MLNLLFFLIGLLIGGIIGVFIMCLLQINRINQISMKGDNNNEKNC